MAKPPSILTPHQKEVLEHIANEPYFTARYYLAGGTALSEFYLHHRDSEDLNLFTEKSEVNPLRVSEFFGRTASKLSIASIETKRFLGLHSFFLHFNDGEVLKVDFNYYPFQRIEKGVLFGNLEIESIYDIAVDKVHTIVLKARARDYIDLFFIIRKK
ncbi:nucleotidyl transferase AbiEii/AbiGii toxin family protein [Candidatus Uhrbacteria bacterium]|nr:nucleotidyl transferase AbiEii/AbiGii toxin family protein [Candidatus Uhrbacteria bacterium]